MKKILVVEDEPEIRELLGNYLRNEGYEVASAADGVSAIAQFSKDQYDLVLLDIMLPKIDGYSVCEVIKKQSDVPVIFLSALGDEKSLLKGYDVMADDYVTKPFSMPVLLRKVRAVLRREGTADPAKALSLVVYGDISMNADTMEVFASGKKVDLTAREFDLLALLLKHPGRVFTREMLLDMLWDYSAFVDERIVDSHVKNLRHKLGTAGNAIETVRGRGYKIAKEDP
ncbi:MAG: response regulator transcription factor [Clostridiales bacterium]|nr:response regulator transcription factor [Clostridiales bacterium]MBR5975974.1 response regulator transcription factor [Clostridiales bacterium]